MQIDISEEQRLFLQANTRGQIFLGSLGSGKSHILCWKAILEALNNRHTCVISFNYRSIKDVLIPLMVRILNDLQIDYNYNISDCSITINNTPILFRTGSEPDRLRGLNLNSFLLDEARELSRELFDIMLGRLRIGEDCFWGVVSTTRSKNWFYDIIKSNDLLDIFEDGTNYLKNDKLTVVRATLDSSPFLPQAYKEELKQQYTSSFAKQELEAKIIDNSGGIINTDWFKILNVGNIKGKSVRFWDLAVSTKTSADFSVGSLVTKTDKYHINNVIRHKLQWPELRKIIINTALSDGKDVILGIEKAGQMGALIDDLSRAPELQNYIIRTITPTKDLITRCLPWVSQLELGNVSISKEPWNRDLIDECSTLSYENFGTVHDDIIASITGAFELLNTNTAVTLTNVNNIWSNQRRMF